MSDNLPEQIRASQMDLTGYSSLPRIEVWNRACEVHAQLAAKWQADHAAAVAELESLLASGEAASIADTDEINQLTAALAAAQTERERLEALLAKCRPYVQSQAEADAMLDGFGPRRERNSDRLLAQVEAAIQAKQPEAP